MGSPSSPKMPSMALWKHAFAYVTLGLLCGWYYFLFILYPVLILLALRGSWLAGTLFATFLLLSFTPLKFEPWEDFMYCWIWRVWREYFDMTVDKSLCGDLEKGKRYMLFEFPHGIFPMGQFLSASLIRDVFPGHMICGTGADVIFMFPVMRQIMAWIGTMPAKRQNISKILKRGDHCAIIPGGIAEMYLMNPKTEEIFLKKRRNTVKAAIQEGAHIIPAFFFGNTRIFHVPSSQDSNSLVSKLSRKLRASVVFFYGRHYLPVPLRHPIHLAAGKIVEVKQNDNPSEEEITEVMDRLIASVNEVYNVKKPAWEDRPLVIN